MWYLLKNERKRNVCILISTRVLKEKRKEFLFLSLHRRGKNEVLSFIPKEVCNNSFLW